MIGIARIVRGLAGLIGVAVGLLVFGVALAQTPTPTPGGFTPENVIRIFDSLAPVVMLIFGVVVTRWPKLANVPNDVIPWVNCVAYILGKFAVGTAHASVLGAIGTTLGAAGTIAYGAFMSAFVSLLYDKFAKAPLDHVWPAVQ